MRKIRDVVDSSGNIFIDLGFPPEEAALLTMRTEIMVEIRDLITDRKLTQTQAAKLLGVSQARISDLMRGKWDKFSLDMLVTLAMRLGLRFTLQKAA